MSGFHFSETFVATASLSQRVERLKTKLDSEGIIEEMRRRRAFESPAERKRRKARTAVKRHRVRWRYISEATEKKIEERKAAAAERSHSERSHSHAAE